MSRSRFRFVSFEESLTVALPMVDGALYIFPTEAAKRAAWREVQRQWRFESVRFLTMEEWKEALFVDDRPLLREEKRTLAFFASLHPEDKAALHITNYFQSIKTAQEFFDLWEEFNEELVPDDIDFERAEAADVELLGWQKSRFEALRRIKERYRLFIASKGFSDRIFLYKPERLDSAALGDVECITFVNQFYYTALEKALIDRLAAAGKEVTLIYQLPAELVDQATLAVRPFTLNELGGGRNQSIEVIECDDDASMLQALLQRLEAEEVRHIVNFHEHIEAAARLLSPERFHLGDTLRFAFTSPYHALEALHRLLSSIILEPQRRKLLLPLQSWIDALQDDAFSRLLFGADAASCRAALNVLYSLVDESIQFIDLEGEFFRKREEAATLLQRVPELVRKALNASSIGEWAALLRDRLPIDKVLLPEEAEGTDALDVFYDALADFCSLQEIGLIGEWGDLFFDHHMPKEVRLPAGILRLLLDYLKSRTVHRTLRPTGPRVEFVDLLDTRNLSFKSVAVMNVVEKEIPHARQTPFLFTEKQRRFLGLKTFEDVLLREKYYFFRLLLTSPRVFLFTRRNIEQNVEVSSFIEEIRLFYDRKKLIESAAAPLNYLDFCRCFLSAHDAFSPSVEEARSTDFYVIPFDKERDLPDGTLDLSFNALENLLDNPFAFYIQNIIEVSERPLIVKRRLSPNLLGQIVHDLMIEVWRPLLAVPQPTVIAFDQVRREQIEAAAERTLYVDRYYYALPHDHSQIYFREIMMPQIVDAVLTFFARIAQLELTGKPIYVLHENLTLPRTEPLDFFQVDGLNVRLKGRADLLIETADGARRCIFDYKTGHANDDQLLFYELYYYALKDAALAGNVSSFFYMVRQKELTNGKKQASGDPYAAFIAKVREQVVRLLNDGFTLQEKRGGLRKMEEITRSDLYEGLAGNRSLLLGMKRMSPKQG